MATIQRFPLALSLWLSFRDTAQFFKLRIDAGVARLQAWDAAGEKWAQRRS
jgi:putative heme degradation protein